MEHGCNLHKAVFSNSPLPLYIWNREGDTFVLKDLNNAALEFSKVSKEQILGLTINDYGKIFPSLRDNFWDCVNSKSFSDGYFEFESAFSKEKKQAHIRFEFVEPDTVVGRIIDMSDLKAAEQEVEKYVSQYKLITEKVKDLVFKLQIHPELKMLFLSPCIKDITGYSDEEFYTHSRLIFDVVHNEDRYILEEIISKEVISEKVISEEIISEKDLKENATIELRWIHKQGNIVWIELRQSISHDRDKDLIIVEGVARDITQKKETEEKLKENQELLRLIYDNSSIGFILGSTEGELLYVNKYFLKLGDYSEEEVLNKNYKLFFHKDDIEEELKLARGLVSNEVSEFQLNKRYLKKNGEYIWVNSNTSAFRKNSENIDFYISIIENVNDKYIAELNLKESEAKYRRIVENANEGIWQVNENLEITFANSKIAEILGCSVEEMTGQKSLRFFDEESAKIVLSKVKKAKLGNPLSFEALLESKTGKLINVIVSSAPIIADDGEFKGAVALISDITKRHQAEMELKNYSMRLLMAQKAGEFGVWEFDLSTKELIWDEEMFKLYEQEYNSLDKRLDKWFDSIHPLDKQRAEKEIKAALKNQSAFEMEFRILSPSGKIKYIKSVANFFENPINKHQGLIGVNYDLTEQKNRVEEIARLKALFEAAFEQNPAPMILAEYPSNKILLINEECRKFFELENCCNTMMNSYASDFSATWVGYDKNNQLIPDEKKPFYLASQGLVASTQEVKVITKSGNEKWCLSSGVPIFNKRGDLIAGLAIFPDISPLKKLEEKLNLATQEAISANNAKSEFIANMSHEIRTPMNVILGFAELLKQHVSEQTGIDYISGIISSGNFLTNIINDILDLSILEADKVALKYEPTSVEMLCLEIEEIFSHKAKEKKLKFNFKIEDNMPEYLILDRARLRQILFNLVGNAVKFTNEGAVSILVYKGGGEERNLIDLVIEVVDTGIGIAEDQIKKIFLSFNKTSSEKERFYDGIGLGLTITKKLVDIMAGTISVESKVSIGSTFTLRLPNVRVIKKYTPDISVLTHSEELTEITKTEFKADDGQFPEITIPEKFLPVFHSEVIPRWRKIAELNDINDIREFSIYLINLASQYNFSSLSDYAVKLNFFIANFDLENVFSYFSSFLKIFNADSEN